MTFVCVALLIYIFGNWDQLFKDCDAVERLKF